MLSPERILEIVYAACILPGMIGLLGYALWNDGRRFEKALEEEESRRKSVLIKLKYSVQPGTEKPL